MQTLLFNPNNILFVQSKNQFLKPCSTKTSPSYKWTNNIGVLTIQRSTNVKVSAKDSDALSITVNGSHRQYIELSKEGTVKEDEERSLAKCWREIQGVNDWEGLLDPMDPLLRSELVRYGEMAQACYDAFDNDPCSNNIGNCKYLTQNEFFQSLEMEGHGYRVTRYLYATSNINLPNFFKKSLWPKECSKHANWIGYVAVSDDEMSKRLGRRDITISLRGTVTRPEWFEDLMDFLRPVCSKSIPSRDHEVKVEAGFLDLYTQNDPTCPHCNKSARDQILEEVKHLVELYQREDISITVTGHSLGSALAILSAYDIAETGLDIGQDTRACPVTVFSFSGPRVGNERFKERLEHLGVKVLRVVNKHDLVPKGPGFFINENTPSWLMKLAKKWPWTYFHVGVELVLDHEISTFRKKNSFSLFEDTNNYLLCAHDLEVLMHLIDGYHPRDTFHLETGRDYALVNKYCDYLDDNHQIPPCWMQDVNHKGMIRGNDGRWILSVGSLIDHGQLNRADDYHFKV